MADTETLRHTALGILVNVDAFVAVRFRLDTTYMPTSTFNLSLA
jgi:hypothetical protein